MAIRAKPWLPISLHSNSTDGLKYVRAACLQMQAIRFVLRITGSALEPIGLAISSFVYGC